MKRFSWIAAAVLAAVLATGCAGMRGGPVPDGWNPGNYDDSMGVGGTPGGSMGGSSLPSSSY